MIDFNTFTKELPKIVGDLGKLIVAKALKSCPKSKKSPDLVTLVVAQLKVRLHLTPEIHSLNPVIGKFYLCLLLCTP